MVSGNENFVPEYINLSISPVKCSHCTLRNEKKSFFNNKSFWHFQMQLDELLWYETAFIFH